MPYPERISQVGVLHSFKLVLNMSLLKWFAQWMQRKERREIRELKARLKVSEALEKKAEELAFTTIMAVLGKEEETPMSNNGLLS